MASRLLDTLARHVLLLDGAMGTSIQTHDLSVEADYLGCENCSEILCQTRPDLIASIHDSFLAAGADAIETNTFGGMPHVLAEFDLQDRAHDLALAAATIARASCDRFSTPDRPRFVVGSIGPGTRLITLGQIDWPAMLASYRTLAAALIAGRVDALLIETCQDLLQIKCAVNACLDALADAGKSPTEIPIMVSVTIETTGTMLVGTSIEAVTTALAPLPIASLGLNCATGPAEMADHLAYLARHWDRPISIVPNAGLPTLEQGCTHYPLDPESFIETLGPIIDKAGVSMVGGCCGTTPDHIAALADHLADRPAPTRTVEPLPPASTSLYSAVEHRQDTSFLIIGERLNASGSRRFKQLLQDEDWDGIVALAKGQLRQGSHILDLNVDDATRDNPADMARIVSLLARQIDAPLMLDSTQAATIEAGLRAAPGKCIINSANFEDGEPRFDAMCALAKRYAAALVIGTIDEDPEQAMARTADRKLAIAARAIDRATRRFALDPADLFIDPLVLPISTGMDADRRSALELIEGVRLIAQRFPRVQLTCGLSNVSFGLKPAARVVLNSMLLHELVAAGLTSAIVHASKILPLNRIDPAHQRAALDLIHDRRSIAQGGTGLPEPTAEPANA